MKKSIFVLFFSLFLILSVFTEDLFRISYTPGEKYKVTEVSTFRKRVDGKYIGYIYRQVRGIMDVIPRTGGGFSVNGSFYVFEETKHDTRLLANQIDMVVPAHFSITPDGSYIMSGNNYYPTTRDFPVFPNKKLKLPYPSGPKVLAIIRPVAKESTTHRMLLINVDKNLTLILFLFIPRF